MLGLRFAALVGVCAVLAGCRGKPEPCAGFDRAVIAHLLADRRYELAELDRLQPKLARAVVESCTANGWPAGAFDCSRDPCVDRLTPGQRAHAAMLLDEVMRDERAARATDPKDLIGSPLADTDVDPMYPTPRRAGTQNLFTLEDPERGPKAPIDFKLPPRGALTWTEHAHCDDDKVAPVCSPPAGARLWRWRVGRDGKGLVVAEQLRGSAVHRTFAYTADPTGSPHERIELDAYGRVTRALLFVEGNRYTGRDRTGANALDGCGFMKYKLDANRRIEQLACEQWLGGTMLDTEGVARTDYARDERGFVVEERTFGLDGKPRADHDGVAVYAHALAADGHRAVTRYRDAAGAPVRSIESCHGRRIERDAQGTVKRVVCLDAADRPAPDGAGTAARSVYKLDAFGRSVSAKHYNADREPDGDSEYHVFEIRTVYDDLDRDIEESCWDADGAATGCDTTGFHRRKTAYDDVGRATEERYLDADGEPVQNYQAWLRRYRYDNYDHLFEQTAHDVDGTPIEAAGVATRRDLFDSAHRLFGVLLLDKSGRPARYSGCYTGVQCTSKEWHAVRIVRRLDGSAERNLFFDRAGKQIDSQECSAAQCWDAR